MIKQTINYNSPNKYFAGFIQNLIDKSDIKGSVVQEDGKVILLIGENSEEKITVFNENIAKYLPHSIFLGEIETEEYNGEISSEKFTSPQYNIAPCNQCLELLYNPSSNRYLDDTLECNFYSNPTDEIYHDSTIFSPHYSENATVLVTNPSKLNDLFFITDNEVKALFSIEKPTIKVTIKDETLKDLSDKNYIYIKSAYNVRSALAALNAKEAEIDYLFFQDNDDLKVVVVQDNTTIIKANRVATPLQELDSEPSVNRFLNIKEEAGFSKGAIGANLSTQGIGFLVSNEMGSKKVITFQDFSLEKFLENIQKDETRTKLFNNFKEKFPQVIEKLEEKPKQGFFETACTLLELEGVDGYETLSNSAFQFRGNGGLKVDTNYVDAGFDYVSFMGSIMSFRLAGAETHYIAYSIFEAFGDLAISTLNQLKNKFKIENFIMMGDMFGNSVLYSRILSKFQMSNPYFSKAIALDD